MFFSDQSGVIRYSATGAGATDSEPSDFSKVGVSTHYVVEEKSIEHAITVACSVFCPGFAPLASPTNVLETISLREPCGAPAKIRGASHSQSADIHRLL